MKRTVAIILLLITISMLLVGCTQKINLSQTIADLQSNGFVSATSYVDPQELEVFTSFTNDEIERMGGSFKVKIVERHSLAFNTNSSESCMFIVFATTNQAKKYANCKAQHFAKLRKESGYLSDGNNVYWEEPTETFKWKVARSGSVVIITNSYIAMDTIDLNFR